MTKAFPGHEAVFPGGVLLSSAGLFAQVAFFKQMETVNCFAQWQRS